jgi:glucose-1-phosphate thymidylyltransferase
VQEVPNGLAQAFVLGREFIGDDDVCLVLGDNIFYGADLPKMLRKASAEAAPTVFGYRVSDPERYGVVSFDANGNAETLEEKPLQPKSNYAVVGLYFYPNDVVEIAAALKPSARGEYEITDVNREYLRQGRLRVQQMGRGYAWLDTGTHQSLADATNFVRAIVERQGLQMSCIEEIAWHQGWIDREKLHALADGYGKSTYGQYLRRLADGEIR